MHIRRLCLLSLQPRIYNKLLDTYIPYMDLLYEQRIILAKSTLLSISFYINNLGKNLDTCLFHMHKEWSSLNVIFHKSYPFFLFLLLKQLISRIDISILHRYIYLRENNYHYRVDFRSISLYINIFISYPYYLQWMNGIN